LETSNLTKSGVGRESLQVINNHFKACHQLGVVMKCLSMLPEDRIDGIRGVTIFDFANKWIIDEIFLCQRIVLDQGSTNDFIEG
jgi:hypothetical protein